VTTYYYFVFFRYVNINIRINISGTCIFRGVVNASFLDSSPDLRLGWHCLVNVTALVFRQFRSIKCFTFIFVFQLIRFSVY